MTSGSRRPDVSDACGSLQRELGLVRLFLGVAVELPQVEVLSRGPSWFSLIEPTTTTAEMNLPDKDSGGTRELWIRGPSGHLGYRFTRSAARTRGSQSPVTMYTTRSPMFTAWSAMRSR